MPRPLSWIDRLHSISRTVACSSRSHYDRKDLQKLFEVQSRSAQNLMAAMPIVSVGSAHLVEREALIVFLQRLNDSEDPTQTLALLRTQPAKPTRRKLRGLALHDVASDLDVLPQTLSLASGVMTVRFQTLEELAEAMVYLASLLKDHLDEFSKRFEPPRMQVEDESAEPPSQQSDS